MIGTRFNKPLQADTLQQKISDFEVREVPNPAQNTLAKYTEAAKWANENNATIEDKGDYYEVVAIPAPTLEEVKERKLSELSSAFDTWRSDGATLISSLGFEADADEKANADVNGLVSLRCSWMHTIKRTNSRLTNSRPCRAKSLIVPLMATKRSGRTEMRLTMPLRLMH